MVQVSHRSSRSVAAANVSLTADGLVALDAITVREPRYPDAGWINRSTHADPICHRWYHRSHAEDDRVPS
ncbi:hypothetical protein BH20ACT2_BH20ACT2_10260 [soil metagenome]